MWELQFEDAPAGLRSRRAATFSLVAGLLGVILGLLVVLAVVVGPAQFIGPCSPKSWWRTLGLLSSDSFSGCQAWQTLSPAPPKGMQFGVTDGT